MEERHQVYYGGANNYLMDATHEIGTVSLHLACGTGAYEVEKFGYVPYIMQFTIFLQSDLIV